MKKSFKLLSLLVTVGMLAGCTIEVRPLPSEGDSAQESTTSQESQGGHSETTSETESQGGQSQESTESHESQGGSSQGGQSESQGGDSQTTESTSEGGQSQESQGGQSEESQGGDSSESQEPTSESTTPVKTPHHIVADYDNEHGKVIVGDTLNTDYLTVDLYYSDNSHDSILDSDDLTFTWNNVEVGPSTPFDAVGEYEIVAHYAPASLASELTDSFTVNVVKRDVTSVEISAPKTNLETGETIDLTVTIEPNNATVQDVEWTFDSEKVTIAQNGTGFTLTAGAIAAADLVVYATVDGHKSNELTFQIVESHVAVTSITLSETSRNLEHHDSFDLSVSAFEPSGASDTEWLYTSSAPTVVSVDEHGHVEALQYTADPVTITVTNSWNEAPAVCTVTVQKKGITSVTIADNTSGHAFEGCNMIWGETEPKQLYAYVQPENATDAGLTPVWKSTNEEYVTVENGLLTAVKGGGNANISVTVGGVESAPAYITTAWSSVTEISATTTSVEFDIQEGEGNIIDLADLKILPDTANPGMTFALTDGDSSKFEIDNDGLMVCYTPGTYEVTVTSVGFRHNGIEATKVIDVLVTNKYGTQTDPISVDEAIAEAKLVAATTSTSNPVFSDKIYHIQGIVSEVISTTSQTNETVITFVMNGTSESLKAFKLVRGSVEGADAIEVGSTVVVKGRLENFQAFEPHAYELVDKTEDGFTSNFVSVDNRTITSFESQNIVGLVIGATPVAIQKTYTPAHSATVWTYHSNDETIATVDASGNVTGVGAGDTTIDIYADGVKVGDISVNVVAPALIESITIVDSDENPVSELSLHQNEVVDLEAVVTPTNAVEKSVTWESSNTDVATVDQTGKITTVNRDSGEANASAIITVTSVGKNSSDEYVSAQVTINVDDKKVSTMTLDFAVDTMPSIHTYTSTWTATSSSDSSKTWTVSNASNNDNAWDCIKVGRKDGNTSVPSVSTDFTVPGIKGISVNFGAIDTSLINGAAIYLSASNEFTDSQTINLTSTQITSLKTGDNSFDINTSISNPYVKFELDLAAGSKNGFIEINSISYDYLETIQYSFNVTQSLTTGVTSTVENEITAVNRGGTFTATYEATTGYNPIDKYCVTVTGGDAVIDDTSVPGKVTVTITNIKSDFTITVVATVHADNYDINSTGIDLTKCSVSDVKINNVLQDDGKTLPSQVEDGKTLTFTLTPSDNYEFKTASAVTITGGSNPSVTFNADGKSLDVSVTVSSTVTISATATAKATSKTVSYVSSAQGYSNQQEITTVNVDSSITLVFNKGTNSNAPKYYTSGTAIRVYGGNYFEVQAASGKITSITITFGSSDGSNDITANTGTYLSGSWTGEASSVRFTIGGTSGNRRIASIEIKYTA